MKEKKLFEKLVYSGLCLAEKCVRLASSPRFLSFCMAIFAVNMIFAQNTAGDYSSGITALGQVTSSIAQYIPAVQGVIYAIAAVVGFAGALNVFNKFNNDEQDITKTITKFAGGCIALIALAQVLPLFFGFSGTSGE